MGGWAGWVCLSWPHISWIATTSSCLHVGSPRITGPATSMTYHSWSSQGDSLYLHCIVKVPRHSIGVSLYAVNCAAVGLRMSFQRSPYMSFSVRNGSTFPLAPVSIFARRRCCPLRSGHLMLSFAYASEFIDSTEFTVMCIMWNSTSLFSPCADLASTLLILCRGLMLLRCIPGLSLFGLSLLVILRVTLFVLCRCTFVILKFTLGLMLCFPAIYLLFHWLEHHWMLSLRTRAWPTAPNRVYWAHWSLDTSFWCPLSPLPRTQYAKSNLVILDVSWWNLLNYSIFFINKFANI